MAKSHNGRGKEMNQDKDKAVEVAMGQIEKQYGKGSIMRLGDQGGLVEAEVISSGSLALDVALGIGGFPRGRIVEIYGPEGAGKTMVSLHAIREAQTKIRCRYRWCAAACARQSSQLTRLLLQLRTRQLASATYPEVELLADGLLLLHHPKRSSYYTS